MQVAYSRQIFEKYSNIKLHGHPVQWEPSCLKPTDRHDEAKSCYSQFCERAQTTWHYAQCKPIYKPMHKKLYCIEFVTEDWLAIDYTYILCTCILILEVRFRLLGVCDSR